MPLVTWVGCSQPFCGDVKAVEKYEALASAIQGISCLIYMTVPVAKKKKKKRCVSSVGSSKLNDRAGQPENKSHSQDSAQGTDYGGAVAGHPREMLFSYAFALGGSEAKNFCI